ncbi:MAG: fimbrial assembly protein [Terracidiphilus sp.]
MRITLNLATRPFVDVGPAMKRLRIGMIVLAVFSLAALGALHLVHSQAEAARAREHSLDGAIAKINAERQGYEAMMAQTKNAQFMTEVDELNDLFEEKAFSWTMAMESLETELPGGVQVTQIEPQRSKTGQITLHLRVAGPHDLADELVKNLEHSKRFQSPRIVGEEAESANTPNSKNIEPVSVSNRFNFDLQAEYVPPTEGELAAEKKKQKAVEAESETEETAPVVAPQPAAPGRVVPLGQGPVRAPARGPYPGVGAPMPPDQQGQRRPYTGGPQ